jgi:polyisoprenoid-binding protein YceI
LKSDSGKSTSVWMATVEMPSEPALAKDGRADVCVIGAVIAGMMTAYLLVALAFGPVVLGGAIIRTEDSPVARYRLDAGRSQFMVRAFAGGPLFFKGHDHFVKVGDFTGEAELTPGAVSPAALHLRVRADSLEETRDVFTPQQKQIINKELREIVLETAKYPEITFKSTDVIGNMTGGQYEAKIGGDLTLHGVTHHIVIPATVMLSGNDLRARGGFTVNRGDYKVKATSAFHGLVRVRDKLKFTFDIVAHRI